MNLRVLALLSLATLLMLPAGLGLHSAGNGAFVTDTGSRSFNVQISTAVWWDHTSIRGVPTGLTEQTHTFEIRNTAPVTVIAETFPIGVPDTPKVCAGSTPTVVAPTVVVHSVNCVKENGYTVQVHYFPWTNDPNDPDHVISPTLATPTATMVWRVDAVPTSYKTAVLEPGHWQVWIDPAVSPGSYTVTYRVISGTSTNPPAPGSTPFYFDYTGTRGCVFYAFPAPGVSDQAALQCPNGYV